MNSYLFSAAAIVCCASAVMAGTWQDAQTGTTWTYTYFSSDNSIEINAADHADKATITELKIPETIPVGNRSVPVTGISNNGSTCFPGWTALKTITLTDRIDNVQYGAFAGLNKLKHAGNAAGGLYFEGPKHRVVVGYDGSAAKVTVPSGVLLIENDAFANSGVVSVDFAPGSSLRVIGCRAFQSCVSLESVSLPNNLDGNRNTGTMGQYAFGGCTALKTLIIPRTPHNIDFGAFSGVAPTTLCARTLPVDSVNAALNISQVTTFGFPDDIGWQASLEPFQAAPIKTLILPPGVNSLHRGTFDTRGLTKLVATSMPSGFCMPSAKPAEYPNLTIEIPRGTARIPAFAFESYIHSTISIPDPDSLVSIGQNAFYTGSLYTDPSDTSRNFCYEGPNKKILFRSTFGGALTLPDSVRVVAAGAFEGYNKPSSLTVPDSHPLYSVKNGDLCSKDGRELMQVVLGANGNTVYTVPDGIETIAEYAFANVTDINDLTIPAAVKKLRPLALRGLSLSRLCAAYLPEGTGLDTDSLTRIAIPEGAAVPAKAFGGCANVTEVTFPANVASVDANALNGCGQSYRPLNIIAPAWPGSLDKSVNATLTVPEGVTAIPDNAFAGCTGLTSVTLPSTLASVGAGAFKNCSGITAFVIPDSLPLTSVGAGAFDGCTALTTRENGFTYADADRRMLLKADTVGTAFVIPDTVRYLGGPLCADASAVTDLTLPAGLRCAAPDALTGLAPARLTAARVPQGLNTANLERITVPAGASLPSNAVTVALPTPRPLTIAFPTSLGTVAPDALKLTNVSELTLETAQWPGGLARDTACNIRIPAGHPEPIYRDSFKGCTGLRNVCGITASTILHTGAFPTAAEAPNLRLQLKVASWSGEWSDKTVPAVITVPAGTAAIRNNAFAGCTGITEVVFEDADAVTSIGDTAFNACAALTLFPVPPNLESIGRYAFSKCTGLTAFRLPDSLTSIGEGALPPNVIYDLTVAAWSECRLPRDAKANVTIPDGTVTIAENAFSGCTGLQTVTFPDSVTAIKTAAFLGCSSLTRATLPDTLTTLEENAFAGCPGTAVGNIRYIDEAKTVLLRFDGQTGEAMHIPASVRFLSGEVFTFYGSCPGTITVEEGNTLLKAVGNALYTPDGSELIKVGTAVGNTFTVPDTVKTIWNYALSNSSPTTLTVPVTVTDVREDALRNSKVQTLSAKKLYSLNNYSAGTLTVLIVPEGVTALEDYDFYVSGRLPNIKAVVLPASLTKVSPLAFAAMSPTALTAPFFPKGSGISPNALETIIIPAGATVKTGAFDFTPTAASFALGAGDPGSTVTEVVIPADATVEDGAFGGVSPTRLTAKAFPKGSGLGAENITSVTVPEGVTSLPAGAFADCTALTSVTLPSSLTSVAPGAVPTAAMTPDPSGCIYDESGTVLLDYRPAAAGPITLPAGVAVIADGAFADNQPTTIAVDSKNTSFKAENSLLLNKNGTQLVKVFTDASGALSVPAGVTTLSPNAFAGCTQLSDVTLPDSVASLPKGTLPDTVTVSLTATQWPEKWDKSTKVNLTIPDGTAEIGNAAFCSCSGIQSVTLPAAGLTSIDGNAFANCSGLKEISIPSSVTYIGSNAFLGTQLPTENGIQYESAEHQVMIDLTEDAAESITVPATVRLLSSYVFGDKTPAQITVASGNTHFAVSGGLLLGDGSSVLYWAQPDLETCVIPDSVTAIADYAVNKRAALRELTIPTSVTNLASTAFGGTAPTTLTAAAFPGMGFGGSIHSMSYARLTKVIIPNGATVQNNAFYFREPTENCLAELVIPADATVKNGAFRNISPTTLTAKAFPKNSGLKSDRLTAVIIPNGVTEVTAGAFEDCSALTDLTLPESLTTVAPDAFPETALLKTKDGGICSKDGTVLLCYAPATEGAYELPATVDRILTDAFRDRQPTEITVSKDQKKFVGLNGGLYADTGATLVKVGTNLTSYEIDDNTTIERHAFRGCTKLKSLTLPPTPNIRDGAFTDLAPETLTAASFPTRGSMGKDALTTVIIPENATVPADAFAGCSKVSRVVFPDTLASVDANALNGCGGPEGITCVMTQWPGALSRTLPAGAEIPEGTAALAAGAFKNCTGLTEITLPASVATVAADAFEGCSALKTVVTAKWPAGMDKSLAVAVVIPEGTAKIDTDAFAGCTALTSVSVPDSVTSIGANAFGGCTALLAAHTSGGASYADAKKTVMLSADPAAETVVIPDTVRVVADGALDGCVNLKTVVTSKWPAQTRLPDAVTSLNIVIPEGTAAIGPNAFAGCTQMTALTVPDSVKTVDAAAFPDAAALKSLTASKWPEGLTFPADVTSLEIVVPEGTADIAAGAFANRATVTALSLPASVETVSDTAFEGCTALTVLKSGHWPTGMVLPQPVDVVVPDGITVVRRGAFEGVTQMKTLAFADSVTDLGDRAFSRVALTEVTLPKNLQNVGWGVFAGSDSLGTVTVPANAVLGERMFYRCPALKTLTLGADAKLGTEAFGFCTGLTAVSLPDTLAKVNDGAFLGCSGLTAISIPASVTAIEENAFAGCTALASLTFADPALVSVIGSSAFAGCSALTAVDLPASVKTVKRRAFEKCTALRSVKLPGGLTEVGDYAFEDCPMAYVVLNGTGSLAPADVGVRGFGKCTEFIGTGTFGSLTQRSDAFVDLTLTVAGSGAVYSDVGPVTAGVTQHLKDAPLKIWAKAADGFVFAGWTFADGSVRADRVIDVTTDTNLALTAAFTAVATVEKQLSLAVARENLQSPAAAAFAVTAARTAAVDAARAEGRVMNADDVKAKADGSPLLEADGDRLTLTLGLEAAENLGDWQALDLTDAVLSVDEATGKLRITLPKPKGKAAFFRFAVPDKQ